MKKLSCYILILTLAFSTCLPIVIEALTRINCELVPIKKGIRRHDPGKARITCRNLNNIKGNASNNWCGYVAFSNLSHKRGGLVSAVTGTWIVPLLHASTSNECYASIWVGIDGFNSETVEQIGTEHNFDCLKGLQTNFAWFEMFPDSMYMIKTFPVNVGDKITANVLYKGKNEEGKKVFVLTVINRTQDVFYQVPKSKTQVDKADCSCAEWIAEAPAMKGNILPLSCFKGIDFSICNATMGGKTGPINNSRWQCKSIRMIDNDGVVKAKASNLSRDGQSFTVSWYHE